MFNSEDSNSHEGLDTGQSSEGNGSTKPETEDSSKADSSLGEKAVEGSTQSVKSVSSDESKIKKESNIEDTDVPETIQPELLKKTYPKITADDKETLKEEKCEINETEKRLADDNEPQGGRETKRIKLDNDEVSEAIEEPPLIVAGEGSGEDCEGENNFNVYHDDSGVGEAIEEPVMFILGHGSGQDCDMGNPTNTEETAKSETTSDVNPKANLNKGESVLSTNGTVESANKQQETEDDELDFLKTGFYFGPGTLAAKDRIPMGSPEAKPQPSSQETTAPSETSESTPKSESTPAEEPSGAKLESESSPVEELLERKPVSESTPAEGPSDAKPESKSSSVEKLLNTIPESESILPEKLSETKPELESTPAEKILDATPETESSAAEELPETKPVLEPALAEEVSDSQSVEELSDIKSESEPAPAEPSKMEPESGLTPVEELLDANPKSEPTPSEEISNSMPESEPTLVEEPADAKLESESSLAEELPLTMPESDVVQVKSDTSDLSLQAKEETLTKEPTTNLLGESSDVTHENNLENSIPEKESENLLESQGNSSVNNSSEEVMKSQVLEPTESEILPAVSTPVETPDSQPLSSDDPVSVDLKNVQIAVENNDIVDPPCVPEEAGISVSETNSVVSAKESLAEDIPLGLDSSVSKPSITAESNTSQESSVPLPLSSELQSIREESRTLQQIESAENCLPKEETQPSIVIEPEPVKGIESSLKENEEVEEEPHTSLGVPCLASKDSLQKEPLLIGGLPNSIDATSVSKEGQGSNITPSLKSSEAAPHTDIQISSAELEAIAVHPEAMQIEQITADSQVKDHVDISESSKPVANTPVTDESHMVAEDIPQVAHEILAPVADTASQDKIQVNVTETSEKIVESSSVPMLDSTSVSPFAASAPLQAEPLESASVTPAAVSNSPGAPHVIPEVPLSQVQNESMAPPPKEAPPPEAVAPSNVVPTEDHHFPSEDDEPPAITTLEDAMRQMEAAGAPVHLEDSEEDSDGDDPIEPVSCMYNAF